MWKSEETTGGNLCVSKQVCPDSEEPICRLLLHHRHLHPPPLLLHPPAPLCHSVRSRPSSLPSEGEVVEEGGGMPCWLTSRKEPDSGKSPRSMTAALRPWTSQSPVLQMAQALLRVPQGGLHPWGRLWEDSSLEASPLSGPLHRETSQARTQC